MCLPGCQSFDRSHALRGNAAQDAPRLPTADAERPWRGYHAERGNHQMYLDKWGKIEKVSA